MARNSVPKHLIHPIIHPRTSDGHGAEYRTPTELAEINNAHAVEVNQAELDEAYRVAGINPDGNPVE